MAQCERCANRGIDNDVARVVTISDVVEELPDGSLQTSHHDAFTTPLCLSCASEAIRILDAFIKGRG